MRRRFCSSSSRICIGAPQSADTFCRILLSTSGTLTAFFAKPGSRCRISSLRGSRPRTAWRPSERCERRWAARFQAASAYSQLTPPAGTLSAASVTGTLPSASVTGTLSSAGGAGFPSSAGTGSLAVIGGAYTGIVLRRSRCFPVPAAPEAASGYPAVPAGARRISARERPRAAVRSLRRRRAPRDKAPSAGADCPFRAAAPGAFAAY